MSRHLAMASNCNSFSNCTRKLPHGGRDSGRMRDLSQKNRTRCLWFFSLCFIALHHTPMLHR